jgi:hypothetical protein
MLMECSLKGLVRPRHVVFKSWRWGCGTHDLFGMSVLWRKIWNWRVRTLHLAEKKRQNHASISSPSSSRLYCYLAGCEQLRSTVYDVHQLLSTLVMLCFVCFSCSCLIHWLTFCHVVWQSCSTWYICSFSPGFLKCFFFSLWETYVYVIIWAEA